MHALVVHRDGLKINGRKVRKGTVLHGDDAAAVRKRPLLMRYCSQISQEQAAAAGHPAPVPAPAPDRVPASPLPVVKGGE
jgi:hypothetical protein